MRKVGSHSGFQDSDKTRAGDTIQSFGMEAINFADPNKPSAQNRKPVSQTLPIQSIKQVSSQTGGSSPTSFARTISSGLPPRPTTTLQVHKTSSNQESNLADEIARYNQQYRKNRSNSTNKAANQPRNSTPAEMNNSGLLQAPPKPATAASSSGRTSLASPLDLAFLSKERTVVSATGKDSAPTPVGKEKKKHGPLLSGLKQIVAPLQNLGKKKTPTKQKQLTRVYFCECHADKKHRDSQWENDHGCIRAFGWLRNKFNPKAAHDELKEAFQAKVQDKIVNAATKEQIQKDVLRTFNSHKDVAADTVKRRMETLLECVALTYPHTGYVQGMNYIAGTLLYHCDEFVSMGIIKILFEQLELKDVFLPSKKLLTPELPGLGRHNMIIDTLILLEIREVYALLKKYKLEANYFCTDWVMCLGLNIIPLEYSVRLGPDSREGSWTTFWNMVGTTSIASSSTT